MKTHTDMKVFLSFGINISPHDNENLMEWAWRTYNKTDGFFLWNVTEKEPFEEWVTNVNNSLKESGAEEGETVILELG